MLNVRSIADLNRDIAANIHRIDRGAIDAVVGIPRSGMIPATIIATLLQKPLADVGSFCAGRIVGRSGRSADAKSGRILLVDDTVNSGSAMTAAIARVKSSGHTSKITACAVYGPYKGTPTPCGLAFAECQGPRAFQWNMWRHVRLGRWACDMDGVLCRDPDKAENDDGERYLRFMETAEPRFLPTRPIGHIVTCRLEKYRAATEAWLARHNVVFGALHMMTFGSKAERMKAGGRAEWKAGIVGELGVEFFIESSSGQASKIARMTGLPVWCTATQELAA